MKQTISICLWLLLLVLTGAIIAIGMREASNYISLRNAVNDEAIAKVRNNIKQYGKIGKIERAIDSMFTVRSMRDSLIDLNFKE